MVRYYGWYSNKMREVRHRGLPPKLVPHRPGLSPPPPIKLPSKRWRDLILPVWHVDPLRCPVCQSPMRVIGVVDDPRVVEKILRHLGAWHEPPPRPPPPSAPGLCYTRLTLGYSKKLANFKHSIALLVAHFNFCRVHSVHGQTPAMAAGLADHPWTIQEPLDEATRC